MTDRFNTEITDLIGKTIKSVEVVRGEFGRTYDAYLAFVCSDGTKVLLYGGEPYAPDPGITAMQKAPLFFTPEDLENRVLRDKEKKIQRLREIEEQEKREYQKLKQKYEKEQ